MGYPKYPCRNCVYFKACGDNTRTAFCGGRMTEKQKRAEEYVAAKLAARKEAVKDREEDESFYGLLND